MYLLCHLENLSFFFVGQKTWKALQPKGEICLVAGLGKKLVSLAGEGSRERASTEVVQ